MCIRDRNKVDENQYVAVILETKRIDFYFQIFDDDGAAMSEPIACCGADVVAALSDYDAQNVVCVGDALDRFQGEVGEVGYRFVSDSGAIDASVLAQMAHASYMANPDGSSALPAPLYLRPPDVSQPKRAPRILSAL